MEEYPRDYCQCFDYPIAWGQYRGHCISMHGFDPGDNECVIPEKTEIFIDEPEVNIRYRKEIEQLKARNNWLVQQITELQNKKKNDNAVF